MELSSISIAITSLVGALFSPGAMFTTGVNGAWYDPSDFSTLFQDAAGTTPVTAVGQPVGRILDKSGRGNHAYNPSGNSANFPVLSARYNLLTKTEQFDDAVWTKGNVTVTANAATAPDGAITADKLIATAVSAEHVVDSTFTAVSGTTYTVSAYVQAAGLTDLGLRFTAAASWTGGISPQVRFNLVDESMSVVSGTPAAYSISPVGGGLYRVSMSAVCIANGTPSARVQLMSGPNNVFTGDAVSGIYIWGADLRVANDALNQPAYQRVNTATDYDTAGFKPYLSFNGVNQWLQTNSIDFTYGDKMFVCAGVRKLSDAATAIVAEMSANYAGNNGVFALFSPGAANSYQYDLVFKGTAASEVFVNSLTYAAPITNVVSGIGNISAPSATLCVNANQVAQNTTSQGTGNYGNYQLYLGARAGTSLWFNGRLYGMVVAGKQASASEIASTEAWLNQKTGAY